MGSEKRRSHSLKARVTELEMALARSEETTRELRAQVESQKSTLAENAQRIQRLEKEKSDLRKRNAELTSLLGNLTRKQSFTGLPSGGGTGAPPSARSSFVSR